MASEFEISEAEVNEMNSVVHSCVVTDVVAIVEGMLQEMKSVTLNIAVTGESGAGKSSFINAFLGISDDEPGAAPTGVTETTNRALAFSHPTVSNVLLWDLPGIGTPSFHPKTYLEDVGLLKYDFFIIVTSDRFQECHSELAKQIIQAQKKFYFIRNKVDQDLEANARRRRQRGLSDDDVLNLLRVDCEKNLSNDQVEQPQVFLLSCFHPQYYDFPALQMTLLEELEGHKRHALLLSLPNLSTSLVQSKREALAKDLWKKAILASLSSVTSAGTPKSVVPKLMETLRNYQQTLCIDAKSLQRLANITGISFEELQSEVTSTFGKSLSEEAVEHLLGQVTKGHKLLANQLEKKVPILGSVIAELARLIHRIGEHLDEVLDEELKRIKIADTDKIKDYFTQLDRVELNIAVTGESGSGKSTFINAFRGLGDEDEGSAETGVVETTIQPTAYPHPKFPNVKLWDLPGIGTLRFKADEYLKQVEFARYDFFIIMASDRFRECHASLAAEIVNMKKRFYFVRSRIDNNIKAEKRKKTFTKEKTLDRIRENCLKGLKQIGLTSPAVFLISCFELNHYDFNRLVERMETELSQHKRNLLILAVPNLSLEINKRKKKALQYDTWKIALRSVTFPSVEIPVLKTTSAISVDVNIIVSALKKYYSALSWDPDSLNKLSEISGRSVDELRVKMKSPLHQRITHELVIGLLTNSNLIQPWLSLIPVLGSLTTPFSVVYNTLKCCVTELADDAHNVLMVVLQSSV
ncbi:Interferon-inducible GTPase 5 [Bagarius yarrelli]|uniref:Interferon-inducible GTPase 5 n=1 Tax=Bagarius yarrelli TaxID=175774 RepID=A0A556TMS2_BAGYA|nr:Interferon-inducible GTPase 5 [Bagarius yarrelli]